MAGDKIAAPARIAIAAVAAVPADADPLSLLSSQRRPGRPRQLFQRSRAPDARVLKPGQVPSLVMESL